MRKRYNTPHRSRVVKTRMTEEEYAEFAQRLSAFRLPHGCGGISGVSRMAGFGEGTPQQDSRRGKMSEKRILVLR